MSSWNGGWNKYCACLPTSLCKGRRCNCHHAVPPNPPLQRWVRRSASPMVHQCAIFFPSEGGVRKREIAKSNGTFPTNIEEGGSGEALSIALHDHFIPTLCLRYMRNIYSIHGSKFMLPALILRLPSAPRNLQSAKTSSHSSFCRSSVSQRSQRGHILTAQSARAASHRIVC